MPALEDDPAYQGSSRAIHVENAVTDPSVTPAVTSVDDSAPSYAGQSPSIISTDLSPTQFHVETVTGPFPKEESYVGVSQAIHVFGTDNPVLPIPSPIPSCTCSPGDCVNPAVTFVGPSDTVESVVLILNDPTFSGTQHTDSRAADGSALGGPYATFTLYAGCVYRLTLTVFHSPGSGWLNGVDVLRVSAGSGGVNVDMGGPAGDPFHPPATNTTVDWTCSVTAPDYILYFSAVNDIEHNSYNSTAEYAIRYVSGPDPRYVDQPLCRDDGTCAECDDPENPANPAAHIPLPPFTPGFMPTFRPQIGDPTTGLDHFICTMESAAMVLDWHTRHGISVWGGELIPWCGKTEAEIRGDTGHPGTSLANAQQAWAHFGQVLEDWSGGTWANLIAALQQGRAIILQGDYGAFTTAEKCQTTFEGNHAVSVYPYEISGHLLVGDPLCSNFKGILGTDLQAYAEAFGAQVFGVQSPQPILFAVSRPWVP